MPVCHAREVALIVNDRPDLAAGSGADGAHIGADYWRVRMGIGHPGDKDLVTDYVLSDFSKAESPWVEKLVDAASEAAPLLLQDEKNDFMTRVALLAPPPPRPRPNKESEDEPEDGI